MSQAGVESILHNVKYTYLLQLTCIASRDDFLIVISKNKRPSRVWNDAINILANKTVFYTGTDMSHCVSSHAVASCHMQNLFNCCSIIVWMLANIYRDTQVHSCCVTDVVSKSSQPEALDAILIKIHQIWTYLTQYLGFQGKLIWLSGGNTFLLYTTEETRTIHWMNIEKFQFAHFYAWLSSWSETVSHD